MLIIIELTKVQQRGAEQHHAMKVTTFLSSIIKKHKIACEFPCIIQLSLGTPTSDVLGGTMKIISDYTSTEETHDD